MSRIENAIDTLRNLRETVESYRNGTAFNAWKFSSIAQTPIVTFRVAKLDAELLERAKTDDNPSEIVGTALFSCPQCGQAHELVINCAQFLSGIYGSFQWSCTPNGSTHVAFGVIEPLKQRGEKK